MVQGESGEQHVLTHVREGMTVYDEAGEEVGQVGMVHLGTVLREQTRERGGDTIEPAIVAATSVADTPDEDAYETTTGGFLASDEKLPEALRGPLMNEGFIRIDGSDADLKFYAVPDHIESVSDENVQLRITRDELMTAAA